MSDGRLWAVVPVKRFRDAKSRLHPVLDSDECSELAQRMLEDVLTALTGCEELSGVLVVTSDQMAAEIARGFGARSLLQAADNGINAAILYAIEAIGADEGFIVVPSDIPQLTREAVAQAAAAIAVSRSMAMVPAEDGGTNLIACRPASMLAPRFGPDSFESHRRAASEAGMSIRILDLPELALDIDRPRHLEKFLALQTKTRTHAFLSRRVIAEVVS